MQITADIFGLPTARRSNGSRSGEVFGVPNILF
jgi:hypothetical protein